MPNSHPLNYLNTKSPKMSIFGSSTFSATGYAAARPTYPTSLAPFILTHLTRPTPPPPPHLHLLDLGCGPGTITTAFAPRVAHITALDPSPPMIATAKAIHQRTFPNISFSVGTAEDLSMISDGTVDVVTAGQSCHWFKYDRAWPEIHRVVRPGGILAFWGYNDNILVGYPAATKIFLDFCYRDDEKGGEVAPGLMSMGRFWEMPGRGILREYLRDVRPPESQWDVLVREIYEPDRERCIVEPEEKKGRNLWMEKRMTLGGFEAYVRTFSAYKGWIDANGGGKRRSEEGPGNVVDVMMDKMREVTPEWREAGENWKDIEVDAVWGTALIIARKRE